MEDGIFWFCYSESILAHLEEMTNRAEAALEGNVQTKILFTVHSPHKISGVVYSFSVYEAPQYSVKLRCIEEKLCGLFLFI